MNSINYDGPFTLERKFNADAGVDIKSIENVIINPGKFALVDTGITVEIPFRYVGKIMSRSGLAAKHGVFVLNAPGIIDSGYTGTIKVVLMNAGKEDYKVSFGDRIAQLLIEKIQLPKFTKNGVQCTTERGNNGFGSTGY